MRSTQRFGIVLAFAAIGLAGPSLAHGQQLPAVERGVQYLRTNGGGGTGETALAALAMIKAEVPLNDPTLSSYINKVEARFSGSAFTPSGTNTDVYETAVVIMALANYDANGRKSMIDSAAKFLISRQKANGSWDYPSRTAGDTSISQYAVLGLWEAENAGVEIDPAVWDRAAQWFLSVQSAQGSWNYHRDEPGTAETVSMTAAGTGSLLICQRQLANYRREVSAQSPYLTPVGDTKKTRHTVEVSNARLMQGIRAGMGWLARNFNPANSSVMGQSPYYGLYGTERIGALAGRDSLGKLDWYDIGVRYITSTQQAGGSWVAAHGDVPNTAWAILFMTKSTAKTVERIRIRRLGAGELYGGKGLPSDLSTISEAGGRLIARPMDGAIEGMLAVLEDPRSTNADSALAGLLARYQAEGPRALRPSRDRFRKLLTDADPGVRRVAAWSLGRMNDLVSVPPLIAALRDPNEAVVQEARAGLQLLGRKIEGFGPPNPSTPEQRDEAAKKWQAWYDSVRPLQVDTNRPNDPRTGGNGR